jgi:hypothetical protein
MSDSTLASSVLMPNRTSPTENHHFGKYVKLNVGNHLFLTSLDTLTSQDTMFKAMFSGRMEVVQDTEGKQISIDFITKQSNDENVQSMCEVHQRHINV